MAFCVGTTMASFRVSNFNRPSASLAFLAGSRTRTSVKPKALTSSATLLHCAFTPSSSLSLSSGSSFAGTSLGLDFKSNVGTTAKKRRSLVVSAKKYQLCQTKRHRSRKSLARTHGFRLRMRTTSGRAVIKRRREKGRWQLCTKTNPSGGKRA